MATNTFPTASQAYTIGPAKVVLISCPGGSDAPLTVVNADETPVAQITQTGKLQCLRGFFFADIDGMLQGYVL
jgi:hypothetical protein